MIIEKAVISSVLILAVLVIRAVFQKKISPVFVYALWLLAAARLLLPGMIGTSPISIMNTGLWKAGREAIQKENSEQGREYKEQKYQEYLERVMERQKQESLSPDKEDSSLSEEAKNYEIVLTTWQNSTFFGKLQFWTVRVWFIGMAAFAVVFIRQNLILYRYLKRTREKLREVRVGKRKIVVFAAGDGLPSPCLFGLFPAIYIPKRCICGKEHIDSGSSELTKEEEERISFILEHELTHYRHGDFIWSLVRILCLVTAWYNPLVWIAAGLSVRDGELACDRGCVKKFGREKRIAYGEALLAMIIPAGERKALLWHATMMTSDGRFIKRRIENIANNRNSNIAAVMIVAVLAVFCVGAVFTGDERAEERTMDTAL